MWIKFSIDYVAGMLTGAGVAIVLLSLITQAGFFKVNLLSYTASFLMGLVLALAGGGLKWWAQSRQGMSA